MVIFLNISYFKTFSTMYSLLNIVNLHGIQAHIVKETYRILLNHKSEAKLAKNRFNISSI